MVWVYPASESMSKKPLFICVLGNTRTSQIPGLSGAGKTPELTVLTPTGDCEIMHTGNIISVPCLPMTPPLDTPTPAVITRTALNLTKVPHVFINAGLIQEPDAAVPTVSAGARTGEDLRSGIAVHDPELIFENGRKIARDLAPNTDEPVIGESTPGGTTTAQGVLCLLGYDAKASSSCDENPIGLKEKVLGEAMEKSGLSFGCFRNEPFKAIRYLGDPMMPAVMGMIAGFKEYDPSMKIVLAGGTQMAAVFACAKAAGLPLDNVYLATTKYVRDDPTANFTVLSEKIGFEAYIADPGFGRSSLPGIRRYEDGTIKEGAGAGGAMYLAARAGITQDAFVAEVENVCAILKAGKI